jgi:hypothetical protein
MTPQISTPTKRAPPLPSAHDLCAEVRRPAHPTQFGLLRREASQQLDEFALSPSLSTMSSRVSAEGLRVDCSQILSARLAIGSGTVSFRRHKELRLLRVRSINTCEVPNLASCLNR